MAEVQAEVRKVAGSNPTQASTPGKLILSQEVNRYLTFVGEDQRWQKKKIGLGLSYTSLVMRKTAFCICENKDADQLRGNRKADQCLCFRYTDRTYMYL